MIGAALSLPLYLILLCIKKHENDCDEKQRAPTDEEGGSQVEKTRKDTHSSIFGTASRLLSAIPARHLVVPEIDDDLSDDEVIAHTIRALNRGQLPHHGAHAPWEEDSSESELAVNESTTTGSRSRGSQTGLSEASKAAAAWTHSIPWWLRPLVPGILYMLKMAFTNHAIIYLDAGIFDILYNGLQLIASVAAARFIRKRLISLQRWAGVAVVVIGLGIIALSAFLFETSTSSSPDIGMGYLVAIIVAVTLQDIAEEMFMQETTFPALLLLGMRGCYALLFAVPLYLTIVLETQPSDPFANVRNLFGSTFGLWFTPLFLLISLSTEIFQILMVGITSAMTRNIWKNFRGLVTFGLGLVLFYSTGGEVGGPWQHLASIIMLLGYAIMAGGIYLYYRKVATKAIAAAEAENDVEAQT